MDSFVARIVTLLLYVCCSHRKVGCYEHWPTRMVGADHYNRFLLGWVRSWAVSKNQHCLEKPAWYRTGLLQNCTQTNRSKSDGQFGFYFGLRSNRGLHVSSPHWGEDILMMKCPHPATAWCWVMSSREDDTTPSRRTGNERQMWRDDIYFGWEIREWWIRRRMKRTNLRDLWLGSFQSVIMLRCSSGICMTHQSCGRPLFPCDASQKLWNETFECEAAVRVPCFACKWGQMCCSWELEESDSLSCALIVRVGLLKCACFVFHARNWQFLRNKQKLENVSFVQMLPVARLLEPRMRAWENTLKVSGNKLNRVKVTEPRTLRTRVAQTSMTAINYGALTARSMRHFWVSGPSWCVSGSSNSVNVNVTFGRATLGLQLCSRRQFELQTFFILFWPWVKAFLPLWTEFSPALSVRKSQHLVWICQNSEHTQDCVFVSVASIDISAQSSWKRWSSAKSGWQ